MIKIEFLIIDQDNSGRRLDNFIFSKYKKVPKSKIYSSIRKAKIKVNGKKSKPDYKLREKDKISCPAFVEKKSVNDSPNISRHLELIENSIIYDSKNFIVINKPPNFAVIDLRLEDGNGLDVVKELSRAKKDSRIVMLTGYGNLPTAVAAVKAGAIDYIAKPVDADDVEAALLASPESKAKPPENPMSADRVKWEHIHRVFELCNRNVSETARRLKMHRRTLQRILSKRSPK